MDHWIGGIVAGVLITVLTQWLSAWYQHQKYVREKLIEKYAELFGLMAADIHRARAVEATFAVGSPFDDETFKAFFLRLEEERHSLSRDIMKTVVQLRLLEPNRSILEPLDQLREMQPFLAPGKFGQGNFDSRFTEYKKSIQDYDDIAKMLTGHVWQRYCKS